MPTKRQRRKRRRRASAEGAPDGSGEPVASAAGAEGSRGARSARPGGEGRSATAGAAGRPGARRAEERPPPPWGSFPLSELVVLVGLILLVAGFLVSGERGGVMMIVGLTLGALGGLELAIREHFAGYKSHTMLLSGAVGLLVLVLLVLLSPLQPAVCVGIAVLAFAASVWPFATAFRHRSGGALFRIRGG